MGRRHRGESTSRKARKPRLKSLVPHKWAWLSVSPVIEKGRQVDPLELNDQPVSQTKPFFFFLHLKQCFRKPDISQKQYNCKRK